MHFCLDQSSRSLRFDCYQLVLELLGGLLQLSVWSLLVSRNEAGLIRWIDMVLDPKLEKLVLLKF